MTILVTSPGSSPIIDIWMRRSCQQHEVFQLKMYASCFQPESYRVSLPSGPLMIPTFTGKLTNGGSPTSGVNARWGTFMNRLLSTIHAEDKGAASGRARPLTARSAVNRLWGTFINRLLSTIHAEYNGASSARSTSFRRLSVLSKPLLITCGGSWAARKAPPLPSAPASATSPITTRVRLTFRLIALPPSPLQGYGLLHIALSCWHPSLHRSLVPELVDT